MQIQKSQYEDKCRAYYENIAPSIPTYRVIAGRLVVTLAFLFNAFDNSTGLYLEIVRVYQ